MNRLPLLRLGVVSGLLAALAGILFFLVIKYVGQANPLGVALSADFWLIPTGVGFTFWFLMNNPNHVRLSLFDSLMLANTILIIGVGGLVAFIWVFLTYLNPTVFREYLQLLQQQYSAMLQSEADPERAKAIKSLLTSIPSFQIADVVRDAFIKKALPGLLLSPGVVLVYRLRAKPSNKS